MLIELDPAVYTFEHHDSVVAMLVLFKRQWHDWAIHPMDVAAFTEFLRETQQGLVSDTNRLFAENCAKNYLAYDKRAPTRLGGARLAEGVEELGRPAAVIVENAESDGCFLRAVATVLDSEVREAFEKGRIALVHGGGVGDACKQARKVCEELPRFNRALLVLDSDRWVPGSESKHEKKARELRKAGVKVHVLLLREAENYVPNRVFVAIPRQRGRETTHLDSLKTLSHAQRGHLDMKNGLKSTGDTASYQRELYEDLPDFHRRRLVGGFGDRILHYFEDFVRSVSAEDIMKNAGPEALEDLRDMLDQIKRIV
ncbi:hypothetical protein [Glycomyces sp. MUSA5-2]|uniref:hypothetical protein n=1 Tax=Glycomyces sp. MUSA5-2 TaxID=2053002 RepID=UPI00300944AB